jgi:hypothetical protein
MRTRRSTLILTALMALLFGPAVARGLAGGQPKDIFKTVDWKELKKVTPVGDSSSNELFIVSDGKTTVIAKFSNDLPLSINFADRWLQGRGIPVPKSLSLPVTADSAKKARAAILSKVPQSFPKTNKTRVENAMTLSLFEPVISPENVGTVQSVLLAFDPGVEQDLDAFKKAAADKKLTTLTEAQRKRLSRKLSGVRALVQCLGNSDQVKLLGRLYELDAFLGNEDRLQRRGGANPNWRNLMLGLIKKEVQQGDKQGMRTVVSFVAIDNRAFAPSLKELAWLDNRGKAQEQLDNAAVGTEMTMKATVAGRKDWVNRLVHGQSMNNSPGLRDEKNLFCCDLDLALQYGAQSKALVGGLRKQLHKLLFTDMKGLLGEAVEAPAETDKVWTFPVVSVSDKDNAPLPHLQDRLGPGGGQYGRRDEERGCAPRLPPRFRRPRS